MSEPARTIFVPRRLDAPDLSNWYSEYDVRTIPEPHFVTDEYILKSVYDADVGRCIQQWERATRERDQAIARFVKVRQAFLDSQFD